MINKFTLGTIFASGAIVAMLSAFTYTVEANANAAQYATSVPTFNYDSYKDAVEHISYACGADKAIISAGLAELSYIETKLKLKSANPRSEFERYYIARIGYRSALPELQKYNCGDYIKSGKASPFL